MSIQAWFLLMLATSMSAATNDEEASWTINAARSAIRAGQLVDAKVALEPLASREDVYGQLARFGLANIAVIEASADESDRDQRELRLRAAIDLYRGLLADESSLPTSEDVAHNLMVAKMMLARLPQTNRKRDAPADALPKKNSSPADETSQTFVPSERPDSRPAEAATQTKVKQATPGIADRDPGPLAQVAASRLLAEAVDRNARGRAQPPVPRPARSARDY